MSLYSRSTTTHPIIRNAPRILALTSLLVSYGFADDLPVLKRPTDTVMGFESAGAWVVKSASPLTTAAITAKRTEGAASFALGRPSGSFSMASMAVTSKAAALANLENVGSTFQLDIMPSAAASGTLQLSLTAPSRGLRAAISGEADLQKIRPGIFNTISFPIPDGIRKALAGAAFSDLSFELLLKSSGTPPSFVFDNLRVSQVSLLTRQPGSATPANFGRSVNLQAVGNLPVKQAFDIGAVQVPETFRLAEGTAAGTSVKLSLGHDGAAAYTCTYEPDVNDRKGLTYRIASCSDGVKPGDLVGANSVEYSIVGGTIQKLQAQLAQNPLGETVGSGIIPPMPTYWGSSNSCTPSLQPGVISPSCAAQMAEANQIATDYFNLLANSNIQPGVIITPVPDRALRHFDGQWNGSLEFESTTQQNDYPFHREGHMNPGGDFDAYWRLNGDLNSKNNTATGDSSAHFDVDFSGRVVVFGSDVDVVRLNAAVDTKSGAAPSATGSVHYFLFGLELPGGGTFNASTGLNSNNSTTKSITVFSIRWEVFKLEVKPFVTIGLKTSGTLAVTGLNVTVTPEAAMGVHIIGGLDAGIAGAEVDLKIELLNVKAPVTAKAGVAINTNPAACSLTFSFSLDGEVTISSLGGQLDLKAYLGFCPFCLEHTFTLLKWDPLLSTTKPLFHVGPLTAAAPLPLALCATTATAAIASPGPTATVGFPASLSSTFTTAAGGGTSACTDRTWTVTPAEPITVSNGCQVSIVFNTPGAHTLTVNTVVHFTDQFGRSTTAKGVGAKTITVAALAAGAHITSFSPSSTGQAPFDRETVTVTARSFPGKVQISGQFTGAQAVTMAWTVTNNAGITAVIPSTTTGSNSVANWAPVQAGAYSIRLTATDSTGKVVGTTFVNVNLTGFGLPF